MRKELLTATALSTAAIGPFLHGQAAAQTPFDWTGFYIGANAGANWSDHDANLNFDDSDAFQLSFQGNTPTFIGPPFEDGDFTEWPTRLDLDDLGPTGGAGAGYNVQVGQFVFGLEADASFLDARSSDSWSAHDDFFVDEGKGEVDRDSELSVATDLDWLATLRARLGVAVGRALVYGTGGLAVGHASIETHASLEESLDHDKGDDYDAEASWSGKNSETQVGITAGIGAEYAATDRVSVKIEGLYYDLGEIGTSAEGEGRFRINDDPFSPLDGVQPYDVEADIEGILARVGVNVGL